jgi:curved DNA-binding protein CbpA
MDAKLIAKFKSLHDIYGLLGIEPTDDPKKIKQGYKAQALIWHPDKCELPEAGTSFNLFS